jgi:hypothetical protein
MEWIKAKSVSIRFLCVGFILFQCMNRRSRQNPENDYFTLSANGGIPRDRVLETLRSPKRVAVAVKAGRCFLCRAMDIDVTGLCLVCRTFLSDEEREAARVYYHEMP